jgi:hypothetical protein
MTGHASGRTPGGSSTHGFPSVATVLKVTRDMGSKQAPVLRGWGRAGEGAMTAPDTCLGGVRAPGLEPARAAVFDDALLGVASGRAGGSDGVVELDRAAQADAWREHAATIVVADLSKLVEAP